MIIAEYNVAFSSKNAKYPIEKFIEITLINQSKSLKKYIDGKLITIDGENNILFSKPNSNNDIKVGFFF